MIRPYIYNYYFKICYLLQGSWIICFSWKSWAASLSCICSRHYPCDLQLHCHCIGHGLWLKFDIFIYWATFFSSSLELRVCLNTAYCWKHCSKIIFKCVNSTVGPRLEVIFPERGTYESRKQCTGPTQGNAYADPNPLLNLC